MLKLLSYFLAQYRRSTAIEGLTSAVDRRHLIRSSPSSRESPRPVLTGPSPLHAYGISWYGYFSLPIKRKSYWVCNKSWWASYITICVDLQCSLGDGNTGTRWISHRTTNNTICVDCKRESTVYGVSFIFLYYLARKNAGTRPLVRKRCQGCYSRCRNSRCRACRSQ
jgi:hypothetical protein